MKKINPALLASGCLGLDVISLCVLLKLIIASSNIGLLIIFIALFCGICIDAWRAAMYLVIYYKMHK